VQHAHVEGTRLTCQLGAEIDCLRTAALVETDAAAEEWCEINRRPSPTAAVAAISEVEEQRSVEEEIAFLRKEEREAREIRLSLIDFRLREVGIDGEVRPQAGGEVVEQIDPDISVAVRRPVRIRRAPLARSLANDVRLDVEDRVLASPRSS
jgi:hypothetical protein